MLTVVLGPNRSGKSLFAERLLSEVNGTKCYVATLPPLRIHYSRIRRHQLRRPHDWTLIELIGEFSYDASQLRSIGQTVKGVLLDGLSVYLERVLPDPVMDPAFWGQRVTERLIDNLIARDLVTIIVDCQSTSVYAPGLSTTIAIVHSMLCQRAEQVYIACQGTAKLQAERTNAGVFAREEFCHGEL